MTERVKTGSISRAMSQEFYDLRYPRPFWFRAGRRLLFSLGEFALWLGETLLEHPIWSILFLLFAYIVWAVISFILHGVTWNTLFTLHTLSELPLSSGAWWQSNWWKLLLILVGLTIAVITLIIISIPVEDDLKREQAERIERPQPPGFNLRYISPPNTRRISQMVWSPDGSVLAFGAYNISLWQPETGTVLSAIESDARVISMAWSPDGLQLATVDYNGMLTFWDSHTGAKQRNYNFKDSTTGSSDHRIAWSPDGQMLALAFEGKSVDLLNIETEQIETLSNSSRSEE